MLRSIINSLTDKSMSQPEAYITMTEANELALNGPKGRVYVYKEAGEFWIVGEKVMDVNRNAHRIVEMAIEASGLSPSLAAELLSYVSTLPVVGKASAFTVKAVGKGLSALSHGLASFAAKAADTSAKLNK